MRYNKTIKSIARITLLSGMLASFAFCFAHFAGGEGTEADPWQIETAEHLNNVRNYLGEDHFDKYFIQTANINLGEEPWNTGTGWAPIGSSSANSFRGTYDGNGYVITGLRINRPAWPWQGLFGWTYWAEIVNVGLLDVDVTANSNVSGLVGRVQGYTVVGNCFVTGQVTGENYVGGLVGYMRGEEPAGSIRDSYSTAEITTTGDSATHHAGGIVGHILHGDVLRTYATGAIRTNVSSPNVGALIGSVGTDAGEIANNYWNVETTEQTAGVGDDFPGIPGNSTWELMQQETFAGFDFDNIWNIDEEASLPYLQWEGEEAGDHNQPPNLPPRNLTFIPHNMQIELNWNAPSVGVPDGYYIYRDNNRITDEPVEQSHYNDTDAVNWHTYTYSVTAVYDETESRHTLSLPAIAVDFAGGSGSYMDPFVVADAEQLNAIRSLLNFPSLLNFKQEGNLDLAVPPWNEDEGWEPIGITAEEAFSGMYDGDGYVISGLTINRPQDDVQALFGYTAGAVIKNLGLTDIDVSGNNYVAGLTANIQDHTRIEQCFVTGVITGDNNTGGIAGYMRGENPLSRIVDCYSNVEITTTSNSETHYVGGIVGDRFRGIVARNYAVGRIETRVNSFNAGAVLGRSAGGEGEIAHNYWNIETTGQTRGGANVDIPGHTALELIQQDTYDGFDFDDVWRIEEGASYPYLQWQGDQAGEHNYPPLLPPQNLSFTAGNEVIGISWENPSLGEPDGYNIYRDERRINDEPLADLNYRDEDVENLRNYIYTVTAIYDEEESMPSVAVEAIAINSAGGAGTEEDPFLIETAEQLHGIREILNFSEILNFRQIADIDLGVPPWNEREGWQPIGDQMNVFTGNYDGDSHLITGLTINREEDYQGLFGYTDGNASIKRLGLVDVDIRGRSYTGGFIGWALNTEIRESFVSGEITGFSYVGGIVGDIRSVSLIKNCFATGSVTANSEWSYVGGITGMNGGGNLIDSYSTMDVNGNQYFIGGLVGTNNFGDIIRCYAAGEVSARDPQQNIGGMVGNIWGGDVEVSYWDTEASGMDESAAGFGRLTRQMTYPRDEETYVGWDFEETWAEDRTGIINNGYPVLSYQVIDLDSPLISIDIADIDGDDHVLLSWQAVDGANSYKVYASGDATDDDWGEPAAIVTDTEFSEILTHRTRYYKVIASIQEAP